MPRAGASDDLVGRDRLLARLRRLVDRVVDGHRTTVLVAGEAGIGKTSLLRATVAVAAGRGCRTAWGTCIEVEGAPGYWPWTQALDGLVRATGVDRVLAEIGDDATLLAPIIPSFAASSEPDDTSERNRLLAMDATARLLDSVAAVDPLLLVVDDLHWADESSLALFDFLARVPRSARIGLIGAYRHDELPPGAAQRLAELVTRSEHVQVGGLDVDAVRQLVEWVTDDTVEQATAEAIHRRTGGHPFFVRELALLAQAGATLRKVAPAQSSQPRRAPVRRTAAGLPLPAAVNPTSSVISSTRMDRALSAALEPLSSLAPRAWNWPMRAPCNRTASSPA